MLKLIAIIVVSVVLMGMFRSEIKRAGIIVVNSGALVYDTTGKVLNKINSTTKPAQKRIAQKV